MDNEKIKVLIADDEKEICESLRRLLQLEEDIEVVGEANDGKKAVSLTKSLKPDIVLMDINMPVLDGIKATEEISLNLPSSAVIIVSVQDEQEYLRKAMSVGAQEYLVKGFAPDELINAIHRVKEFQDRRKPRLVEVSKEEPFPPEAKVITVFGTKGGVGRSLIATNLAVSLREELKGEVVIVDLDLQFGDIAMMLNLTPKFTISDLTPNLENLDKEVLKDYLTSHSSGVKVLASPSKPAEAERVGKEVVEKVLELLKESYGFIIIDTVPSFEDIVLTALDFSDLILLLATLDLPTIKNTKLALETMSSLKYPPEKIRLVLNRSDSHTGLKLSDIEGSLHYKVSSFIPSDGKLVVPSVSRGVPFVSSNPESEISKSIRELVHLVSGEVVKTKVEERRVGLRKFLKPIFARH
ncbi:MAG: histidine kinase [Armatimonadetes bacterium CG07_land_8_20_14_0_80_40_9]|nr:MAG: histidine kinase [Armatimonadetes bacterium CG07_land_8_20_14_0_80_40_9]